MMRVNLKSIRVNTNRKSALVSYQIPIEAKYISDY